MYVNPELHRQLVHDRRRALTRQADVTRLRRDLRAVRKQLRRSG